MAKSKSLNPADAQRKAERKKELKKNKTERQKNRDFALVKKDTTSIDEDIQRLEKAETDGVISGAQKIQLSSLRVELARINKKKDEWVAEHPEHRKLVFRARYKKDQEGDGEGGESQKKVRKVFDKHGIPRHPERSVYYDSVMNPFGVAPPGMPYMERPLRPDEVDSQAEDGTDEDDGGSDDEIVMPAGPPPSAKPDDDAEKEDEGEEEDIPMPEGPPPSKLPHLPPLPPPAPLPSASYLPHLPFLPNFLHPPPPPPPPPGFPAAPQMGFPPFPPSPFPHPALPPPPPPPGFNPQPPGWTSHPSRPRLQSDGSLQDPLTSVPHQTFQAYRAQQANMNHPLPDKPTQDTAANKSPPVQRHTHSVVSADTGTISAPAQLRDLKKESTAFVPSSLKRKKPGGSMNTSAKSSTSRINAAPESSHGDQENGNCEERPDLLGALKTSFPTPITKTGTDEAVAKKRKLDTPEPKKGKDDYEKFIEEIGDIL